MPRSSAGLPCRLCAECATLVENHDKIRALSYAHKNVEKVGAGWQGRGGGAG